MGHSRMLDSCALRAGERTASCRREVVGCAGSRGLSAMTMLPLKGLDSDLAFIRGRGHCVPGQEAQIWHPRMLP
jgi:hypothetical protein